MFQLTSLLYSIFTKPNSINITLTLLITMASNHMDINELS